MLKKLKSSNKGFTIIEVLIVLAIAALILLIIFLAVPALQRNSRNTAIRNDAAGVLGGVSEYQSLNNGSLPTSIAGTGTINYGAGNTTSANVQGSTTVALAAGFPAGPGTINIQIGATCAGGASARAYNAKFLVERAGGTAQQCVDS